VRHVWSKGAVISRAPGDRRVGRPNEAPAASEDNIHQDGTGRTAVKRTERMSELITPDELLRWVPGELTMDSAPLGWDGVRLRG
jgi:hypothetical protein